MVRFSSGYVAVLEWISYSCKKDFVFLARVSVSSPYFSVLDCVSYSCAIKRSLDVVRVSSGYFAVL